LDYDGPPCGTATNQGSDRDEAAGQLRILRNLIPKDRFPSRSPIISELPPNQRIVQPHSWKRPNLKGIPLPPSITILASQAVIDSRAMAFSEA